MALAAHTAKHGSLTMVDRASDRRSATVVGVAAFTMTIRPLWPRVASSSSNLHRGDVRKPHRLQDPEGVVLPGVRAL